MDSREKNPLPDELLAVLRNPDVVLRHEGAALDQVVSWLMGAQAAAAGGDRDGALVLPHDQFAWTSLKSRTERSGTTTVAAT